MLGRLKALLKDEKSEFFNLCQVNHLKLDYQENKAELAVLRALFQDREYADYFPFYEEATILDIGAHYGYFSIFAHLNTAPESRIIAVEPSSGNFKQLSKNLQDNRIDNVQAFNMAIGGSNGQQKLFKGKSVNHSIRQDYRLLSQGSDFEGTEVMTLESLIQESSIGRVDFLKLDCEGAEYEILAQTPSHIFDRITTLSMEFHDLKDKRFTGNSIIRILKAQGFDIVKFQYDKTTMNLNYGKIIGTRLLSSKA